MNKKKNKVLVLVSTKIFESNSQDLLRIPQIDVSMLLPCYGPFYPLCGIRIFAKTSNQIDSAHAPVDILFRVGSPEKFLEVAGLLRSKEWQQEGLQPMILADPYLIETVSQDRIFSAFPILKQDSHIHHPEHQRQCHA